MGDVPLGVLLSGGVDSSAVAAVIAQHAPGRLKTFTMGFEGDAFFDERPWAAQVARHLGAEHYEAVAAPHAAELMETLLHHHDEPFGDSSALPTYLVAREARRHVKVALNGDGGDETFAGYDRFRAVLISEALPSPARHALGRGRAAGARRQRHAGRASPPEALRAPGRAAPRRAHLLVEQLLRPRRAAATRRRRPRGPRPRAVVLPRGVERRRRSIAAWSRPVSERAHVPARRPAAEDGPHDDGPRPRGAQPVARPRPDGVRRAAPRRLQAQGRRGARSCSRRRWKTCCRRRSSSGPSTASACPSAPGSAASCVRWPRTRCWPRRGWGSGSSATASAALLREHAQGAADHGHKLWTLLTLELWLRKHRLG